MRTLVHQRTALVEQSRRWPSGSNASRTTVPLSREQSLIESRHDNSLDAFLKAIRT